MLQDDYDWYKDTAEKLHKPLTDLLRDGLTRNRILAQAAAIQILRPLSELEQEFRETGPMADVPNNASERRPQAGPPGRTTKRKIDPSH